MSDPSSPGKHDEPATVVGNEGPVVPEREVAFVIEVIEGLDRGLRFAFDGERASAVLVGQSAACDVRLTDRRVSRRHFALDGVGSGLRLRDLDSTNGTSVSGLRVVEAYLVGGEVVRLGETALRILRSVAGVRAAEPGARVTNRLGRLVGESPEMRRLYPICARLAASDVPVVIEGETGTGKEVMAEAIHHQSPRAGKAFVVFDCTAIAPSLVESALFGHERGAFTGAHAMRRGVFESAHGGTLFIDEIGDLDLALQPKLLRAIERGEVQRVGSPHWLRVDVRIVTATRRDLDREVQAGRFRDDLFYRLAVGRIELPPLRRRRGDIGVLARHFWAEVGGGDTLPPGLLERLEDYPWPGNVRELQNAILRHFALGELGKLPSREVPPPPEAGEDVFASVLARDLPLPRARAEVVDAFERLYIERLLERHGGSVTRAAASSGLALRYFQLIKARHSK